MSKPNFQNLRVYCLAETLADGVRSIVYRWDFFAKDTVGKPLVSAADSVGANIAEGSTRGTYQDNRRFVRIVRGPLTEVQHRLRRAYNRNLLSDEDVQRVKSKVDEFGPRLNACLNSIGKARHNGPRATDN